MLRTPVNVRPQNIAIDSTIDRVFSFTFSGKNLIGYEIMPYDCMTEKPVGYEEWWVGNTLYFKWNYWIAWLDENRIYNNETVSMPLASMDKFMFNGRNYKFIIRICQNKHDNVMLSGRIRQDSEVKNQVYISKGLRNEIDGLKEPVYFGDKEFYSQYFQIGYERHKLIKIDEKTSSEYDILTLDEEFENLPKKGDSFKVISNYIISPFYYFKCRSTPTLETFYKLNNDGTIYCSADYSQEQNADIKKYKWQLYKLDGNTQNYNLIKESPFIFNERLDYTFSEYLEIGTYKAKCIVYTQDDMIVEDETDYITTSGGTVVGVDNVIAEYDDKNKAVDVKINTVADVGQVTCNIYRKTINDENDTSVRLIAKIEVYNYGSFKDYLISNNKSYQYYVVASNSEQRFVGGASNIICIDSIDSWTLTSLKYKNNETLYGYDKIYKTIKTWSIELGVQNQDVVNNINREIHVGNGQLPKVSMNNINYITSGFSGLVKNFDCSDNKFEDNIEDVESWRNFITGNNLFLIKSPKGDLWICSINDCSTKYDDITYSTTVSVNFTEVEKTDDILLNYGW